MTARFAAAIPAGTRDEARSNVIVARFLGTGPAGGRPGAGHSRRTESSLALYADDGTILIDVTRDFATQLPGVEDLDLVLLTHAHRDACGGLPCLDRRRASEISVLAAHSTVRTLNARHPRLRHVSLHPLAAGTTLAWRSWLLRPLAVPHARDCTTFAWRLEQGGCTIVYASDVARLTPSLRAFADAADLLVLDGAMWRRTIFTHLEITRAAPIVARWPVRRVLFTQLGRSTPAHGELDAWLRAFDARFGAAYDGLQTAIGLSATG
jgi:phosphoribosyl 1,2-cyclic phosphodiesterase